MSSKVSDQDYCIFLCMQKKPTKITVPQFGGWEQKPQGVPTDYSMVFSQARANKKNQKADLTALQRLANGKPWVIANANHRHGHGHGHSLAHAYARAQTHEDPSVLVRKPSQFIFQLHNQL
ncbi:hypothetical protein RIF29_33004 [Crotalaria pallida]|uniref:RIN4 pathogenic type III effector avirulence factor Avr cleavage site domain-containing protein n=1 Tax=Crotalaria pallida TaxID=3830 RepID=A0AAN9ED52_CROPI